jgi:hypothetical protein
VQHRQPSRAMTRRRRLDQAAALLNGLLLQRLVFVLGPGGVELRPVLLRLSQHARQNALHVFVTGRRHRHHRPALFPLRLGHQQVQVRRELEARAKPLPEAHASSRQRAPRAVTAGFTALPPPHRLHQPHLEPLEQLRLLHHGEAHREGHAQRPLPVRDAGQHRLQVNSRLQRPARRARRTPASPLAAERHHSRLGAVCALHFNEAVPHVAAHDEALHLLPHPPRHCARHLRPAPPKGLVQH